jgi:alkaline phosphatase D
LIEPLLFAGRIMKHHLIIQHFQTTDMLSQYGLNTPRLITTLIVLLALGLMLNSSRTGPQTSDLTPLFKPAPLPASDVTLTRIGFGSCVHQGYPQRIWQAVKDAKPQLFLLIGDNVYGDVKSDDLAELKLAYQQQARHPDFAAARRDLPMLAVWDDHDYGVNDGGADFAHKHKTAGLFFKFWQIKQPSHGKQPVYRSHIFGRPGKRVQIILLDTRSYRSKLKRIPPGTTPRRGRYIPSDAADQDMLGARQWKWLAEQLQKPADLRLIVSSVQVLAAGHGWESWDKLPREQQKLFEVIRHSKAENSVFLSGDCHMGAIYRQVPADLYPLYDFTSSSMNRPYPAASEPGPNRLTKPYGHKNFGLIQIDWENGTLRAELRGLNGAPVATRVVSLQRLKFRKAKEALSVNP